MTSSAPADEKRLGAVVYTDGSAKPVTGHYGMGVHGYTFVYANDGDKPTQVNAYVATDKGYILAKDLNLVENAKANPVIIVEYLDISIPGGAGGTNNVAEVLAPVAFFEAFPDLVEQLKYLHILSDSKYMLQGATQWVFKWLASGWLTTTGQEVSNREHWERLHGYLEAIRARGEVSFGWVKGHDGNVGNVQADYLAGLGTNRSIDAGSSPYDADLAPYMERKPVQGYWKNNIELHPLLSLKRIYFNTDAECHTAGLYYQTGYSDTNHISGKRTPDASFSVVRLVAPDPIVEAVLKRQHDQPADFNSIAFIKMDRLRAFDVYRFLKTHGAQVLAKDNRSLNLNFLDRKPVTLEVRPGELPLRTIEVLNHLEEILDRFCNGTTLNGVTHLGDSAVDYQAHDITSHFYEPGEKRRGKEVLPIKLLRKEFGVGAKDTNVTVSVTVNNTARDVALPLAFVSDIPGRNAFKAMEDQDPRIFLITWKESATLLRYSTIIQASEAIGVWSNYFANQLFL